MLFVAKGKALTMSNLENPDAAEQIDEEIISTPEVTEFFADAPSDPEVVTPESDIEEVPAIEEIVGDTPAADIHLEAAMPPIAPATQESPADQEVKAVKEKIEPEKPVETERDLLKSIGKIEREIEALSNLASDSDHRMEAEGDKLEEIVRVQEEFNDWVTKRRGSYSWQLLNRLEAHRKDLEADEKLIRDFSSGAPVIEEGFGEKTRKWFMKRFWINFLMTWGIVAILLLINKYSDQISSFLGSAFNWNSVFKYGFSQFLQEKIGLSLVQLISWIFGLSFASFVGLLFAFSRKNSEHLQVVAEENARTNAMEKGIHQVREARERIDSLHPQVPQILEVLSLGLHQPWVIDNESLFFRGSVPNTAKLPSCVEVAVPTIDSRSPKYEELIFRTMNKIQIPGWRSESYGVVLQKLAESIGFGSNGMALREIDEDHRKTGKRQLAVTAGKNPASATIIGVAKVESLTKEVQESVLPVAQPDVVSLRPDPLEGLQLDGSLGISSNVAITKWEDKLAEIADLAAPWSVSTFSNKGTASNRHQSVESIFIASARVDAMEGVTKASAVNPGARPFEVAIRVDLSDWCKPDEVAIFSDFKPTPEQVARWAQGGSTHGERIVVEDQEQNQTTGGENLVL